MAESFTRENRPIRRLAAPLSRLKSHYNVVVVGSGYGAAVVAARLARATKAGEPKLSVCVLERGEELHPGEYPSTPEAALKAMQIDMPEKRVGFTTALYDFRVNGELNAFVGCGLGGGSLVNANVSLQPERRVLLDPTWPSRFRDDIDEILAASFERAKEMLKPTPYPETRTPAKLAALRQMNSDPALSYQPPINVHFGAAGPNHVGVVQLPCTDCGDCVSGCNVSAKNTLLMNYLPDAVNHGAEIFVRLNVRSVERDEANGRWLVRYMPLEAGVEKFDGPETFIAADYVFLGAGALGSTEILLRSQARGLPLSSRLGSSFTGNGDVLAFAYNCEVPTHPVGFGTVPHDGPVVGPCITGIVDLRASAAELRNAMVIEEGSLPSPLARMLPGFLKGAALLGSVPPNAQPTSEQVRREIESALLGPYHGAVDQTQVLLVMSHDDAAGRLSLIDNRLRIRWPGLSSQAVFGKVLDQLRAASESIGGILVKNPAWSDHLGSRLITVHPLGGCVMAENAQSGVVDHAGRVFRGAEGVETHRGLFVCDGAVIPRPLGVNPLLTISAVSERIVALAAKKEGWFIDYSLPSSPRPADLDAREPIGLQFTETMRGYISELGADYEEAAAAGERDDNRCHFTLTITSTDLDSFIGDPSHRASIVGSVTAPVLSPWPLAVSEGLLQLMPIDTAAHGTRRMRYTMKITTSDGREFRFNGFKTVRDDPGPDVWTDTTTLFVDIQNPDATPVAKGILRIEPADFAVQLTTVRALGAKDVNSALKAKARFARFFAGALSDTYAGIARSTPNVWPPAKKTVLPVRERRALRLPPAEVHTVATEDGVSLRLTRFNGGPKGPVMLCHGLGVSSRIYTLDTIDTNLAEYLCSSGFDTWLLDFRASIDLPSATRQFSGDEVARFDYPAAVEHVRQLARKDDIQVVAHCFGASTLAMALASGLSKVRSAVFSQVAAHVATPVMNRLRAALYMPDMLRLLGLDALTTDMSDRPDLLEKLYDRAISINPAIRWSQHCSSAACHRISFMYAPLYQHGQLNDATHEGLGGLFGIANVRALQHLAAMIRAKKVVAMDKADVYFPKPPDALARTAAKFRLPILFVHGGENECFLPKSTEQTFELLKRANPTTHYDRVVIPKYGHIDCIFGKDAVRDVYPHIVRHLEQTA